MEYCRKNGRRILVTIVCSVQNFISSGLIFGFCVMYADLIDVFSTSRLACALIQGTFNFLSTGGGILWTWPIRHLGLGLSMVCASVMACAGLFASSLAPNSQTVTICTGVICGTGISLAVMGPFAVIGLLYKREAGFPLALLTVAVSAGQMTMPHVYRVLLEHYHWAGTFILLAGIALQGLPCGIFIHYSSDLLVNGDENEDKSAICDKRLCMDHVFWCFLALSFLLYGTGNFEMWFLVDQMTSLGHSQVFGTVLLSLVGFANLFSRILGSFIKMRKNSSPTVYNMFYVCPLLAAGHSMILLLQSSSRWIFLACIVYGFAYGLLNTFAPVILYDLVEHDMYPEALSQFFLAYGIGNLMWNFTGGKIRDIYGSYNFVYDIGIAAAVLSTFCFMIIAYLQRKRDRERKCLRQYLRHHSDTSSVTYESIK